LASPGFSGFCNICGDIGNPNETNTVPTSKNHSKFALFSTR